MKGVSSNLIQIKQVMVSLAQLSTKLSPAMTGCNQEHPKGYDEACPQSADSFSTSRPYVSGMILPKRNLRLLPDLTTSIIRKLNQAEKNRFFSKPLTVWPMLTVLNLPI